MNRHDPWQLVLCSGAEHLRDQLVRKGFDVYTSDFNYDNSRMFANGDVYTALPEAPSLAGKRVCVIQSLTSSGELDRFKFSTQDRIVELLQMVQILQEPTTVSYENGERQYVVTDPPAEVVVLCTHMAFSKQDQIYRTGEVNASKRFLELLYQCGVSRVAAIDPHVPLDFPWIQELIQQERFIPLSMYKAFVDRLRSQGENSDIYFVSTPGKRRTPLGVELREVSKERISTHEVLMVGRVDEEVAGKRVCLIDDMVISGTTLKNARKLFSNQGATEVLCWVTHTLPLYPSNSEENLRSLVKEYEGKIYVSNSIRTKTFEVTYPYCQVSVVPIIVEFLEKV
jgi:phosphoribosylpyrophosphate synthetase